MLVITRKHGERFFLKTKDGRVAVRIELAKARVRCIIDAPPSVTILREELVGMRADGMGVERTQTLAEPEE